VKLLTHSSSRKGDIATILATWNARNRQSAAVNLVLSKGIDGHPVDPSQAAKPLIKGDIAEVQGVIFGIAQIAWSWGWRPAGLQQAILDVVQNHGRKPKI
jgi:hypothetical protein